MIMEPRLHSLLEHQQHSTHSPDYQLPFLLILIWLLQEYLLFHFYHFLFNHFHHYLMRVRSSLRSLIMSIDFCIVQPWLDSVINTSQAPPGAFQLHHNFHLQLLCP